uniref:Rho GTPase activating protein 6 n=1 Tax=Pipistrellus kuhlii TaxID=59472 RepID=A0A7J7V5X6_PIPKU|nr:hypothetical protein mPipKuh1_008546 [Pipistrellus kuhlii]
MSAQSLLHSVFSCSSPAPGSTGPGFSKRKLRQTRSLDPALIGGCGGDGGTEGGSGPPGSRLCSPLPLAEGLGGRSASSPRGPHSRANRLSSPRPLCASFSTPSTPLEKSPSGSFHFDYEVPSGRSLKKSTAWDLPSVLAGQGSRSTVLCSSGGGSSSIFASPRRWLQQRKLQSPTSSHGHPYVVWKCEVGSGGGPSCSTTYAFSFVPFSGPGTHRGAPVVWLLLFGQGLVPGNGPSLVATGVRLVRASWLLAIAKGHLIPSPKVDVLENSDDFFLSGGKG